MSFILEFVESVHFWELCQNVTGNCVKMLQSLRVCKGDDQTDKYMFRITT